jgi:ATP-dependent DNA helicase RecG
MNNEELIELIDELRALPKENEWVEFKSGNATTNDKIGQYISAISNAACLNNQAFGYFVFGIDDATHTVVGTNFKLKNRKEGTQELELFLRQYLHPSIRFNHFVCQYDTKHYLEIFRIPAAKAEPTHFKKIPYIRFDSSLTDLRNYPEHVKAIYNSEEDWSANCIDIATIEDLDPDAIAKAKDKFKEKNAGTAIYDKIDLWDPITFLDKAKITIGGKITNTAIILLGKPEASHFISPSVAQITWKLDTEEKAYEHFDIPLFVSINDILKRIRNVKYKFFPDNQLLYTEVNKYDTKVILEALNNCIAHQDYSHNSRIVLTEQVNKLIFSNQGGFFEGTAEDYTTGEKTPKKYRNRWLVNAMVNLNMIDTMGYGIYRMYVEQRKRFFPLPDYTKSTRDNVILEIYGHTIDENYSKLLIEKKDDLSLTEVILLDKVQKHLAINDDAAKLLKKKNLIEGRKNNYYISATIAEITGQKAEYIRNRGLKDEHYKKMVLDYLNKYNQASKGDIDKLILDILPEILDKQQKENKVRNLLYAMHKKDKTIENQGTNRNPIWKKFI